MKTVYNKNDEREIEELMGFEPAHNGENGLSADGDSTHWAIHADNNGFQNHT